MNWKDCLNRKRKDDEIIFCTLSEEEMSAEFDGDFGVPNGQSFLAWSEKYVYFPVVYDGREKIERLPRNPTTDPEEINKLIGGY